jgi:hypothetical protein
MSALSQHDPAFAGAMTERAFGCPVFPVRAPVFTEDGAFCSCPAGASCPVPGKHPHVKNWTGATPDQPTGYSTEPAQLARWAANWPGCNWGALTGRRAGRIIIECDPRAGGDDGLYELEHQFGPLPDTRTYRTGSGGTHYVFAYPALADGQRIPNSAGALAAGVDVRGDGGMGILPGSLHKTGNRYELIEDVPLAELPAVWVADLVDRTPTPCPWSGTIFDGPRADIAPIMAGCHFMRHARDDAATLSEPDWFTALSIAANTEDGISHAHQLSEAYPLYSYDETEAKAERAQAANRPMTCETIASRTDGRWCTGCPHWGRIKSPVMLGRGAARVSSTVTVEVMV